MKLFGNITEEKVYKDSFSKLSEDLSNIRMQFLIPLTTSKGKSIIKVENKIKFQERIKKIIEKLPDLDSKLKAILRQEILKSKKRIKDFDLTFDDLSDYELLNEFKKKEIMSENDINGIVEIKKAFEARK